VTVHAADRIPGGRAAANDIVHERLVAAQTTLLQDPRVARRDHDGLVEVHEGEALRMVVAVRGFRQVLRDKSMGQVTVDASRDRVMRAAAPRGVLLVHDVAVLARARIGREVAETLSVLECVRSEPRESADKNGGDDGQGSQRAHAADYSASVL